MSKVSGSKSKEQFSRDSNRKSKYVFKKSELIESCDTVLNSCNLTDGLVIQRFNDRILVEFEENSDNALHIKAQAICSQRQYLFDEAIVAGDQVEFQLIDARQNTSDTTIDSFSSKPLQQGIVTKLKPRRNILQRPTDGSNPNKIKFKNIGSNIDQLLIVTSVIPTVPLLSIDRYIVAALHADIPNIRIIVSKADLPQSEEYFESLKLYDNIGIPTIAISTNTGFNINTLRDLLENQTCIIVGQSGVGKSSLVSTLLPATDASVRVGALTHNEIGAHTTSNSRLYHLPNGGAIIDSPGIRELATWHITLEDLKSGFVEIESASNRCKYRNCKHTEIDEVHCGVRMALQEGIIATSRYNSYMTIVNESR